VLNIDSNNHKNNLLSDSLHGTQEFNVVQKNPVQEDLERIDKMFDVMNALCDVFIYDPKRDINKWASSKVSEHTKKINNSFLL
jgi:hypothetical protein